MSQIRSPYTVHEAEVAIHHAWGDGLPVGGPFGRHRQMGVDFRAGMKLTMMEGQAETAAGFGEWRMNAPGPCMNGGWLVEFSVAMGPAWDDGVQAAAISGLVKLPVVVVVRFRDPRGRAPWRVLQFHDAVLLPAAVTDDSQRMMRTVRVAAGWMEEFKCGVMPGLEPRVRGVIEWRHLGRVVRCFEYDPYEDAWAEDPENVNTVGEETVRYVSMDEDGGSFSFSMLAAVTEDGEMAGVESSVVVWRDVVAFEVEAASSGLTLAPGWTLESDGLAEPLLLPPSGRHWEHPRVVFRVCGRTYATMRPGVLALPALTEGVPDDPLDLPIAVCPRLLFYPEGGFVLPPVLPP